MLSQWVIAMVLAAPLTAASAAPTLKWEDLDGIKAASADYKNWIIVYTFADRESSEPLMAWQDKATLAIVKRHPEVRIAHVNFADVSAVPSLFKGVAEPVMRAMNNRAIKRMYELFDEAKVPFDPEKSRFHLIPDWKGVYLKAFGLKDAAAYHVWIVADEKVAAYWDAETPGVEKKFVDWFDGYASGATVAAK